MRGCNGHCKSPLTRRWRYEATMDPVTGFRFVMHDDERCVTPFEKMLRAVNNSREAIGGPYGRSTEGL